ncbi:hypothetical protein CHUUTOTORO_00620 [Serratia phage vB_SmaM-ChuuTotoro]|nr:hypothetical protein CHUUTOTORO_00620 [Serratia phage vB_SmaM-ChuuTotoro]
MDWRRARVIFLDIDGVLNYSPYRNEQLDKTVDLTRYVDRTLCTMFANWVNRNGFVVVGVSSWFIGSDGEDLKKVSEDLGFKIFCTGDRCGGGFGRGTGVLDFVERNKITKWAVIDDAGANMYLFPTVIVNGRIGVTPYDLMAAKNMIDIGHSKEQTTLYRQLQQQGERK